MIESRIIDNDMGAVMKVPLTGRGTIHGFTMVLDFVTGQELNPTTKKMEDVLRRVTVTEIDMGLLEMLAEDMGVTRVTAHCAAHLHNPELEQVFVDYYKKYVSPIYCSGRSG